MVLPWHQESLFFLFGSKSRTLDENATNKISFFSFSFSHSCFVVEHKWLLGSLRCTSCRVAGQTNMILDQPPETKMEIRDLPWTYQ